MLTSNCPPMRNNKTPVKYLQMSFLLFIFAHMKHTIRLILSYMAAIILLPIALLCSLFRRK